MSILYESFGSDPYYLGYLVTLDNGINGSGRAQGFTPSVSHNNDFIKLKMSRVGNPGNINFAITATSVAGTPSGGNLNVGSTSGNTLPTDPADGEWRQINLLPSYGLGSGTTYAIVATCPTADITNFVYIYMDEPSAYSGGVYSYKDILGNWNIYDGDLGFEEWSLTGGFIPRIFIG